MKTFKLYLFAVLIASAVVVACGDTIDEPGTNNDSDTGNSNPDTNIGDVDLSLCDASKTCAALINANKGADCVADFGFYDSSNGRYTNQAGYKDDYNLGYVGFYGYNDLTEGATQLPEPNYYGSEPSGEIKSCDANNDSALHFYVSGFDGWGAGVGMDWGGEDNPACLVDGALDCLQLRIDNDHTALATAEDAEACQNADGSVNQDKIDCFKYGKYLNAPKDLSNYKALGFWTLATENNLNKTLKVTFPIPASMRFYSELYAPDLGYGTHTCNEDDEAGTNDCYNDYYATVELPVAGDDNVNKWMYHEISFNDLELNTAFGLQLNEPDVLGADYDYFPPKQSMGLKFQVDTWQQVIADVEFYLDDITLIRK